MLTCRCAAQNRASQNSGQLQEAGSGSWFWGASLPDSSQTAAPFPNRPARTRSRMTEQTPRNLLGAETSAYLLQHKDNPVHWQSWGEAALHRARQEDRPILLSIGYSACHWCHVMAHESFEDEATARLMNEHYVNIKVDREERPDLDKIYQLAHQMLARQTGGWPLTIFLTPHQLLPFFSGTYFPREPHPRLPAFQEVLRRVAAFYREETNGQLRQITDSMQPLLRDLGSDAPPADPQPAAPPPQQVLAHLRSHFDPRYGGFGGAPKFPQTPTLEYLLGVAASGSPEKAAPEKEEPGALQMALTTLRGMALGGLCDQVSGGFFRYSVDERWEIPHFEKMLYDNALLLPLYAQAWSLKPEPLLRETALRTAAWMIETLQNEEGGFHASLDADTAGREGGYYVWGKEELRRLLTAEQWENCVRRFNLEDPPNFEGVWHLRVKHPPAAKEATSGQDAVADSLRVLAQARAQRPAPGLDDKVLCAWNALAIKGLARSARILRQPELETAATKTLAFVRGRLWCDGILYTQHCKGRSRHPAYLDDYAFLLEALLELLECRWRQEDLDFARTVANTLLDSFECKEHGGFYFTAHQHERLPARPRTFHDESLPSGNSAAARALNRLGGLLGEQRYLEAAQRTLHAGHTLLTRNPEAGCGLLTALEEWKSGISRIVIRAPAADLEEWKASCATPFRPQQLVLAIPTEVRDLPPEMAIYPPRATAAAYLCQGVTCQAVLENPRDLAAALAKSALGMA